MGKKVQVKPDATDLSGGARLASVGRLPCASIAVADGIVAPLPSQGDLAATRRV